MVDKKAFCINFIPISNFIVSTFQRKTKVSIIVDYLSSKYNSLIYKSSH